MHRRIIRTKFFICCCLVLLLISCKKESEIKTLNLTLIPSQKGFAIPQHFTGLSYEMTEITSSTYFSQDNSTLIQLVKNLGDGVLRIGAAGVDRCYWFNGPRSPGTPNNAITTTDINRFAAFNQKIDWPVIFGLNLADYNPLTASDEASYVSKKLEKNLLAFEIGNEPDIYDEYGYCSSDYSYAKFKLQFDAYAKALKLAIPGVALSGPAISYKNAWSTSFAADGKNSSKVLTAYHYPLTPVTNPSINRLLGSKASTEGILFAGTKVNP